MEGGEVGDYEVIGIYVGGVIILDNAGFSAQTCALMLVVMSRDLSSPIAKKNEGNTWHVGYQNARLSNIGSKSRLGFPKVKVFLSLDSIIKERLEKHKDVQQQPEAVRFMSNNKQCRRKVGGSSGAAQKKTATLIREEEGD
ncbi:hypothetical protein HF521_011783 [Silurus meridionalis]|uniref:Uncharacterized protein n=1 Tax=Silurus meridionalis TaxID=175797 RepID=A0A8T0AEY5_SILME|nr:hypothetical protein HF521_011783 [Silurus meridionalis]